MANEKFMLPYKVTDVQEMAIVRNMDYPRLAAPVPRGIKFLVTKSDALYWDDCKECLLPISNAVFVELFFPISYYCERYSCNVTGIIKPKQIKEAMFLHKLTSKRAITDLTLDDVELWLTDLEDKCSMTTTFNKRLELLQSVVGDIGETNIDVVDYREVSSYTKLQLIVKETLAKDKTSSVYVASTTGILYDNTGHSMYTFSVFCSLFQLGCTMCFKGVLKDITSKTYTIGKNSTFVDETIDVATFFTATYKDTPIKLSLTNVLTNGSRVKLITLRKLWLQNKSELVGKEITFTGFAFVDTDSEAPIGATFLKFNKI